MSLYATPPFADKTEDERRIRHAQLMYLMGIGPPATGPVIDPRISFWAPLLTTLVPIKAGNPTFTFQRATTAYVADNENILRQAVAGEARFAGARRVRNLHTISSELLTTGWNASGAPTLTSDPSVPPGTGIVQSTKCVTNAVFQGVNQSICTVGQVYTKRVWLRGAVGGEVVGITDSGNTGGTITLTTAWVLYSKTWTAIAVQSTVLVNASGQTVYIAGVQTEAVDGQSNQAPGDYVSVGVLAAPYHGCGIDGVKYFATTNGNSVAGNIVTEATGTPIPAATLLGYVAENAATNLCLQSQTFDNASWVKTGVTITPNTHAATDGTLTADTAAATAPVGTVTQTITVTAVAYAFSIYMKRIAGAGSVALIIDGTVTDVDAQINSSTWTRVFATKTPAAGARDFSVRISTSGDSVAIWQTDVATGAEPSSPIPTTTAAVVRNIDALSWPLASNASGTVGTAAAEATSYVSVADVVTKGIVSFEPAGSYPLAQIAGYLIGTYDGTGVISPVNQPTQNVLYKTASRWGAAGALRGVILNGGAIVNGAFDGNMNGTTLQVGNWAGTVGFKGSIRNVKIYNVALTDVEIQALTA